MAVAATFNDVQDPPWRVRLFETQQEMDVAVAASARFTGDNEAGDALYISESLSIMNERSIGIKSVHVGGRVFQVGELVTMYSGKTVGRGTKEALTSDHTIQAYGHPGHVIIGKTSRARKLAGLGAASLINDASVNLVASVRRSRELGRTTIVRYESARTAPNVEFIALVLESEYDSVAYGLTTTMPSVRIGVVALLRLSEGSELSISYGDSYWRTYIEHHVQRGSIVSLASQMSSMRVSTDQRRVEQRTQMARLRAAAGI